jgi:hypothetical protein
MKRRILAATLECGHDWTGTPSAKEALEGCHCSACAVQERRPTREERWENETESLLRTSLSFAVPLWVERYRNEKRTLKQVLEQARHAGELVAEQGDALMFRTKPKDHPLRDQGIHHTAGTAAVFNALAAGLAAASFIPGGVNAFGAHFESDPKWLEAA